MPPADSPAGTSQRDGPYRSQFVGSILSLLRTHWDHEPATDRSADSLVCEFLGLDSRGHGCPRSDRRFLSREGRAIRLGNSHRPVTPLSIVESSSLHEPGGARLRRALISIQTTASRRGNAARFRYGWLGVVPRLTATLSA